MPKIWEDAPVMPSLLERRIACYDFLNSCLENLDITNKFDLRKELCRVIARFAEIMKSYETNKNEMGLAAGRSYLVDALCETENDCVAFEKELKKRKIQHDNPYSLPQSKTKTNTKGDEDE